ncbi:MAG: FadR family transcriptional regulator, partial [Rhodospirillaceae bacterium]|nr:FadR family transcriptional regulator [Rhodospirillaceae bacterium]
MRAPAPAMTVGLPPRPPGAQRRHCAAAEQIGKRILRGDFAPGVVLPNEAEWCRRLRMSRSVVREAMKMLNAKGLVSSRPKVGTRVEPRERWNLLDRDVLLWYAATSGREAMLVSVQQMRRIFEPEAAALAAVNRSAAQMAAISAACRDMGTATTHEAFIEADVRFHLAILTAAGNEFLVPLGMLVESALATLFDYVTRKFGELRHAQAQHEEIERAIRLRRPRAARRAVLRLLADTDEAIPPVPRPRRGAARAVTRPAGAAAGPPPPPGPAP